MERLQQLPALPEIPALLEEALVYFAYLFAVGQEVQAVLREAMETREIPEGVLLPLMVGRRVVKALLLRVNPIHSQRGDGALRVFK